MLLKITVNGTNEATFDPLAFNNHCQNAAAAGTVADTMTYKIEWQYSGIQPLSLKHTRARATAGCITTYDLP